MITTNAPNAHTESINCGDSSVLFNPFKSPQNGSELVVVDKYRYYLSRAIEFGFLSDSEKRELNKIYKLATGKGVNLKCDCGAEYCHVEAIKEIIQKKLDAR